MIARRFFLAAPLLLAGCPATFVWPEGHQRGGEGSPDAGDPGPGDGPGPDGPEGEPPDKGEGGENGEGEHD